MTETKGAVLLVGAGRMGGALIKGWIAGKRFAAIHVIEPSPSQQILALAKDGALTLHSNAGALPALAAIVIAIKPQVLKAAPDLLKTLGAANTLVVSIAAGVTTAFLKSGMGPDARLVRAMPNTPGAIGKGITALYAHGIPAPDRALAEALMASLGETLWLEDEALMDAVTAVSGSGPAYVFLLAEALAAAGRDQGLDETTANRLARATVSGAGALLAADTRAVAELRKEVTSPGGTTEAALKVLMADDGLPELMRRAIDAATKRGKELGEGVVMEERDGFGSFPNIQTIRFERVLSAPAERVWEFLTQSELFSEWLGAGVIEPAPGGRVELQSGGGPVVRGSVIDCDAPYLLEFSWQVCLPGMPIPIGADSVVRIELAPREGETMFSLTQGPIEKDFLTRSAAGWHGLLDILAAQISGCECPDMVAIFNRVHPEYEKLAE